MSESNAKPPIARPPFGVDTCAHTSGLSLSITTVNRHIDLSTYAHRSQPGNVIRLTIFELQPSDVLSLIHSLVDIVATWESRSQVA